MIRILIVDDMKECRLLLEHYLKDTPYDFISAKNGIEAIASFRKESRISLILMDMEMPVMDGYTAARTICSMMGENTIPIIAMTAHEGEQEVSRCIKAGCTGYLGKPVTQEALFKMLAKHFKGPADCSTRNHPNNSLENIVVHIDPDIAELVPGYLSNRKRDTEEIRSLLAEGNFEAIRIIGHSMAGSGGGYGFPEIGRIGKAIEAAALEVNPEEIRKKNSELAEYLSAVTVVERKE